MKTLHLRPLTAADFAPYGEVFEPDPVTTRLDHVARLENLRAAARPNLFMARTGVTALPHAVLRMESHPWSSQSFAPFGSAAIVIAVALPDPAGLPDLATLRAFAARSQGFSYRAGVWHLPIASLDTAVPVLGFMYEDGSSQDCVWADVAPHAIEEG